MTSVLLTLALLTQAPNADPTPPPAQQAQVAPGNTAQSEIQKTLAKRQAARQKRLLQRQQAHAQAEARAQAQAEYEARMAPNRLAQQNEQTRLMLEAQRANALQQLSNAAMMDAEAARARYRLESQALGQPQIFVPGQGFVPYPYSTAQPIRPFP